MSLRRATSHSLAIGMTILATAYGTVAMAQSDPKQPADPADSSKAGESQTLEEIVVTARKTRERLIDVPISISVLDSSRFEQLGATNFSDLADSVPNLQLAESPSGTTGQVITIRGIGILPRNVGIDQGISFYLDGVYLGRNAAYNLDLQDIERVEVLRGPQGTLYGRNAIGGAINYVTKKPHSELDGSANARYGDYNGEKRLAGSVNVPFSDKVFAQFSGAYWDTDGYVRNVVTDRRIDGSNGKAGRAQLRILPSENLTIDFSVDGLSEHNGFQSLQPIEGPFVQGPYIANLDFDGFEDRDLVGTAATIEYGLGGGFTLSSVTSWRRQKLNYSEDGDLTPFPSIVTDGATVDEDEFSQELRIASPRGRRAEYVAGMFYLDNKADSIAPFLYPLDYPTDPGPDRTFARIDGRAWAIFGQVDFHATDKLTLTAGVRYNDEEKDLHYRERLTSGICDDPFYAPSTPACTLQDTPGGYPLIRHYSDSKVTWTASLGYKLLENTNLYATVSEGFKAGGFNADINVNPTVDLQFDSETVTNYELGFKSALLGGHLQLNLAAFWLDYRNLQQAVLLPPAFLAAAINAGKVRSKGAEAEFVVRATDRLRFTGGLGFIDGEYVEFDAGPFLGGDLSGNKLPTTSRWSGNLTGEYRYPLHTGELVFIGNMNTRSFSYTNPTNLRTVPGRTLYDARIGYRSPDDRWTLFAFGENLTDKRYLTSNLAFGFGPSVWGRYGTPRSYGAEIAVRF